MCLEFLTWNGHPLLPFQYKKSNILPFTKTLLVQVIKNKFDVSLHTFSLVLGNILSLDVKQ